VRSPTSIEYTRLDNTALAILSLQPEPELEEDDDDVEDDEE